jgi:murein DD-endopeptidase MepM/ murein hydrolase activator NlpD
MQSLLQRYKSSEREIYKKTSAVIAQAGRRLLESGSRLLRAGSQSVSILVIAHNEEPPRGIRLSFFGLAGILMLAAACIIMSFAFSGGLGRVRDRADESSAELTQAQDELEALRAQTSRLSTAYRDFQSALAPIMASGGAHAAGQPLKKQAPPLIFAKRRAEAQSLADIRTELDLSAPAIAEYGAMLGQMDAVKRTVPAIWPINGGIGHISTTFGTNPNPFTGQSYFHTGIDASTYRSGDLLVATSDGKVVFAGVEGGYGRCVIIAHAYGYMTRFGHMDRILVHSGQTVKQGQGIGILGNTGVSTAPHTHYEVILGRRYLDPTDYLWSGANSFPIVTGGGFGE